MDPNLKNSRQFLHWLETWEKSLPGISVQSLKNKSKNIALISEDMVKGFCRSGALSSPNVAAIIPRVTEVFEKLDAIGVSHFLLFQDTHDPHACEFTTYPSHCVVGTDESKTIPELTSLPFADKFTIFEKNSLSSFWKTEFNQWLKTHPEVDTFIVVGDCTDICVYLVAVELKTMADSVNKKRRVIVPADCVATYDMPVEKALKLKTLPHDASFLHLLFCYHMRLNGIEVVSRII